MECTLGPYPPPYGGVSIFAKEEFEAVGGLFIGTSGEPMEEENLVLLEKKRFWSDCPRLLLEVKKKRGQISEISAHYATTFGFVAFLARKFYKIPYNVTCHGTDVLVNLDKFPYSWFTRRALTGANEVRVVSRRMQDFLSEREIESVVVEERIDKKKFKKKNVRKKNQIIFIGSVTHVKGVDLLVEAFARIAGEFQRYNLVIVGRVVDERYYESLGKLVEENGLTDKVQFLGERTDIPDLLNESRLFVLPSRSEGYGRVLVEAIACGLPCVAADVGGVREAGKDGNCTFVDASIDGLEKGLRDQLKSIK